MSRTDVGLYNYSPHPTPHTLRHSFASETAREGHPMNLIQSALGHSSLAVTSRYLAHLQPEEVIQAMQKRKWQLSP